MPSRIRRAFTLIELLCVIAIIGILASIVNGLSSKPPKGLDGATFQAQSVFAQARAQAQLGNDPDVELTEDQKKANPLRFIRSRVLVLNDPTDTDRNLRFVGVIVGGYRGTDTTKSEKNLQEGDLSWYTLNDGVLLPQGYYYVNNESTVKAILQSDVYNKTFGPATMTFDYGHRQVRKSGSGQKYYYYEFLNTGAANMTDTADKTGARFMITEGTINPATQKVEPLNASNVGGFIVLRPGTTLSINNKHDQ